MYGASFDSWESLCDLVEDDAAVGLTRKGLVSLDASLNNGALLRRYSRERLQQQAAAALGVEGQATSEL